jgi:ribosome-associated protein
MTNSKHLVEVAVKGLQDKKGKDIRVIELKKLPNAVCDYFIIATGTSNTHVSALADAVAEETRKILNEKPWHTEGWQNAEWILLDYADVVVHVFQPETRDFYRLEDLWADAPVTVIEETE